MIDIDKFIFLYRNGSFSPLVDRSESGLRDLLTFINNDPKMTDIRWQAYVLATVYRECGGEWLPIEEYGKGVGKPYGKPTGPHALVYYGRGYTQNTWYDNYKRLTDAWNKQHPDTPVDFTLHPELLLIPEYSYWVTSYAMINGKYTGVGLSKYINDTKCDYFNARRIINGLDCAKQIETNAVKFQEMIEQCQV